MIEESAPTPPSSTSVSRRIARALTEVLAPAVIVAALLVVMSIHTAPPADAVRWAAFSILFASVIPMAYVVHGVRRKRIADHHIGIRTQRIVPMLVAMASTIICLWLLHRLGAPRPLVALAAAGVAGLGVTFLITLAWKISMHAAVLGGAIAIVLIVFGPRFLPLVLLLGAVCWARVELGDHSMAQVAGGSLVGAVVATAVFITLR